MRREAIVGGFPRIPHLLGNFTRNRNDPKGTHHSPRYFSCEANFPQLRRRLLSVIRCQIQSVPKTPAAPYIKVQRCKSSLAGSTSTPAVPVPVRARAYSRFSMINLELGRIIYPPGALIRLEIAFYRMKSARFAHAPKKIAFFRPFLRICPCVPFLPSL